YGSSFARLPVLLNIVQLIGWTTFELVVMRDGVVAIGRQAGILSSTVEPAAAGTAPASAAVSAVGASLALPGLPAILVTLAFGALLLVLLAGTMVTLVRRIVGRFALPLVILSL